MFDTMYRAEVPEKIAHMLLGMPGFAYDDGVVIEPLPSSRETVVEVGGQTVFDTSSKSSGAVMELPGVLDEIAGARVLNTIQILKDAAAREAAKTSAEVLKKSSMEPVDVVPVVVESALVVDDVEDATSGVGDLQKAVEDLIDKEGIPDLEEVAPLAKAKAKLQQGKNKAAKIKETAGVE
jgi:predicted metal-binding transcription factor (methanogenesis marker protein 9)